MGSFGDLKLKIPETGLITIPDCSVSPCIPALGECHCHSSWYPDQSCGGYATVLPFLLHFIFKYILSLFIYFERERERAHVCQQGRGRERGKERIPSRLYTVSMEPNVGLDLTKREIMIWAKIKSQAHEHWVTQEPVYSICEQVLSISSVILSYSLFSQLLPRVGSKSSLTYTDSQMF